MKDVYNPDKKDVLAWLNSGSLSWPASDWDYYVMSGEHNNDLVVFELANDPTCLYREFFVHALYYFVGDYFNEKSRTKSSLLNERLNNKRDRINKLLQMVKSNEKILPDLKLWFEDVNALFQNDLPYEVNYWLHHLFYEDIN